MYAFLYCQFLSTTRCGVVCLFSDARGFVGWGGTPGKEKDDQKGPTWVSFRAPTHSESDLVALLALRFGRARNTRESIRAL